MPMLDYDGKFQSYDACMLWYSYNITAHLTFISQSQRTPFSTPARSVLKIISMVTGELDFDGQFRLISGGGPGTNDLEEIPFPPVTYIMWIILIILLPVLLINLLVGHVIVI